MNANEKSSDISGHGWLLYISITYKGRWLLDDPFYCESLFLYIVRRNLLYCQPFLLVRIATLAEGSKHQVPLSTVKGKARLG